MKKQKGNQKSIIIIVAIIAIAVVAIVYIKNKKTTDSTSTTTTTITEVEVGTQTIQKTLTGSGEISASSTGTLSLSTSKYFKSLCVEIGDEVANGANIVQYSDGTYLTAEANCIIESCDVPETGSKCTSSNIIKVSYLDTLNMSLSVDESEINSVKVGQEVEITLSADSTKKYTGKISKINSIGTYATSGTTFTATIEFKNDGNVKIGMSASCTVVLEEATNVIAVPVLAVQTKDSQKYVIVVKSDGTTENINIETGISNSSYVQVTSGLSGGEKIQMIETTTKSTGSSNKKNSSNGRDSMQMPSGSGGMGGPSSGEMSSSGMSGHSSGGTSSGANSK